MEHKSRYAIGGHRAGQRYDRHFIDNGPRFKEPMRLNNRTRYSENYIFPGGFGDENETNPGPGVLPTPYYVRRAGGVNMYWRGVGGRIPGRGAGVAGRGSRGAARGLGAPGRGVLEVEELYEVVCCILHEGCLYSRTPHNR